MGQHIWLTKNFGPNSKAEGFRLLKRAIEANLAMSPACMYVGYCMEMISQSGRGRPRYRNVETTLLQRPTDSVSRTDYRRGKNSVNYESVGRRMLELLAPSVGLDEGTPAGIVWDMIAERRLLSNIEAAIKEQEAILKAKQDASDKEYMRRYYPNYASQTGEGY